MFIKTSQELDAFKLFSRMSYDEIEPYKDIFSAKEIIIKNENSEDFIRVLEIKEKGINVEKIIDYSLSINKQRNKDNLKKELLEEYLTKYSDRTKCCVSVDICDYDDILVSTLNKWGIVKISPSDSGKKLLISIN